MNKIKLIRIKKRMTQKELAEKAKVSLGNVKVLESKENYGNCRFCTLVAIAKALEIELKELF